ncbi:MAG TPA: HNH endonuclease, partial [Acidimicrobiia bacterium]|nr:HNH endonuclease [Acidimicrobiia bacterium]
MEAKVSTPAELTDGMDLFHAESNRSLAQLLEMVVEYDRRGLWRPDGATSMASWLCFQFGLTPRIGRDWVEVAHALAERPAIKTEFVEGRLSFEQVKYACRLATPETDGEWAEEAR